MVANRDIPFLIGIAAFVVALIFVATVWRSKAVVLLDPKNREP